MPFFPMALQPWLGQCRAFEKAVLIDLRIEPLTSYFKGKLAPIVHQVFLQSVIEWI